MKTWRQTGGARGRGEGGDRITGRGCSEEDARPDPGFDPGIPGESLKINSSSRFGILLQFIQGRLTYKEGR